MQTAAPAAMLGNQLPEIIGNLAVPHKLNHFCVAVPVGAAITITEIRTDEIAILTCRTQAFVHRCGTWVAASGDHSASSQLIASRLTEWRDKFPKYVAHLKGSWAWIVF